MEERAAGTSSVRIYAKPLRPMILVDWIRIDRKRSAGIAKAGFIFQPLDRSIGVLRGAIYADEFIILMLASWDAVVKKVNYGHASFSLATGRTNGIRSLEGSVAVLLDLAGF